MTTTIVVKANHGWPVDVTAVDPKTGELGLIQRVEKNTEREFHVHSGQDFMIHEVQPEELLREGVDEASK